MLRFVMPVILIGISVAVFVVYTNPFYTSLSVDSPGIVQLRTQAASYDEALNNSKALEVERDVLTQKDNSISADNKAKLKKLLPDNIDNIRLILEIGQIALPYGMVLKDVKYSATADTVAATGTAPLAVQGGGAVVDQTSKDYGVWDLEFSTEGSYNNFLNFTQALESNLRIVDVSSIQFSSDVSVVPKSGIPEPYKYNFKIRTYWLKN